MRRIIGIVLVACFIAAGYPGKAAAENSFEMVFKDGLYGGMAGALVGGAILVFNDHPRDHLNYLSYGAAIGVIVGVTFGLVSATRSLAELDDQRLVFNFPVPEMELIPLDLNRREVLTSVDLLTVRFR